MPYLPHRTRLTASLGVMVALALAPPALASGDAAPKKRTADVSARGESAPCPAASEDDSSEVHLVDSSGMLWDINRFEGYVDDGGTPEDQDGDRDFDDAYDGYGYAYVSPADDEEDYESYSGSGGCSVEDNDREVVFPKDENVNELGVDIERKVYVPSDGLPFARFLDVLSNPSATESITFNYEWYGDYGEIDQVTETTDGDDVVDFGERWGSFLQDEETGSQVDQASFWDGPNADDGWDRTYGGEQSNGVPNNDGNDQVDFIYESVTLEPGERAVFMHVEHQNRTATGAREFAVANGDGQTEFFAGMSDEELDALRNWRADSDEDGVFDQDDNCVKAANADQADQDGDGLGDACDDDIDGDGLTNDQETALGLDPRKADTDGDGKADGVDRCGTRAGTEADGCPATTVTTIVAASQSQSPPPAPVAFIQRLRPNRVTASVVKSRTSNGLRLRTRGRVILPAGVTPLQGCRSGALLVTVKSGKRTVSTRVAQLKTNCTYGSTVTFSQPKRLGNRALDVVVRFTGNERLFRRNASRVSAGRP